MLNRLWQSLKINKKQNKEDKGMTEIFFPPGVPEIIQGYLSDDKPGFFSSGGDLTSVPSLTFFGDPALLIAHEAAYHVLWGRPKEFKAIMTSCPKALLSRVLSYQVERIGPHGCMKGSLYQLLLYADDRYITDYNEDKTFFKMVLGYLPEGEAKKQEAEWFKDWDEKAHVKELKDHFDKVTKIFDESKAITQEELKKDIKLHQAILFFKEYLKNAVLHAKKNCIPQLWDHAAQFYTEAKFIAYGGYTNIQKNRIICFELLGTIDVHLPAWGMQVLARGICHCANGDKTHLTSGDITDISDYYDVSSSGLGVSSYMNILGGSPFKEANGWRGAAGCPSFQFIFHQAEVGAFEFERYSDSSPNDSSCLIL
jgi:hypothetical protein